MMTLMASLPLAICNCARRAGSASLRRRRQALPTSITCPATPSTVLGQQALFFSASPAASSSRSNPSSSRRRSGSSKNEDGQESSVRYNYNPNPFDPAPAEAESAASYPLVTARDLARRTSPPRKVKLLAREFIDDSLYNPNYGYFPKQAVIFDPDKAVSLQEERDGQASTRGDDVVTSLKTRKHGFAFDKMRNMSDWDEAVADSYGVLEEADQGLTGLGRQVWHTPTELFKPYYAQAVAHHLATEYKLSLYPYNDLNIYEIGAGNGSLMSGVLDFLRVSEPEVYSRTQYHTIEISDQLATLQQERARKAGHGDKVQVIRSSIFDWKKVVEDPCFFLAFEVLDNLSHDVVRYRTEPGKHGEEMPLQCLVEIDSRGEFSEVYEPVTDPLIRQFLKIRREIRPPATSKYAPTSFHPLIARNPLLRKIYSSLPFSPNLSPPDFLPTRQLQLLQTLKAKFPQHKILMSDFDYLPDTVQGRSAPVVQTRYEGKMVTCSTYLVSQGWFDIFFPTDFKLLRDMYEKVMMSPTPSPDPSQAEERASQMGVGWRGIAGNSTGRKPLRILSHRQFLQRYGEPEYTQLKDGSNPMLDLYENAAFIF